jgi:hypothetical protein
LFETLFKALTEADRAMSTNDYPALATAAGKIADLIPQHTHFVKPLYVIATRLAESGEYVPAAINAAKVVARYAPPGSDLEQGAVSLWSKHAEVVPEAATPHHRAVGQGFKLTLKI